MARLLGRSLLLASLAARHMLPAHVLYRSPCVRRYRQCPTALSPVGKNDAVDVLVVLRCARCIAAGSIGPTTPDYPDLRACVYEKKTSSQHVSERCCTDRVYWGLPESVLDAHFSMIIR